MTETVVLIHGLWMPGPDQWPLKYRLGRRGFHAHTFRYPTVRSDIVANAAELDRFLRGIKGETVHLVGHSMGGLIIRRLLADFPDQRPGRIVTIGTPHNGSHAARYLAGFGWGQTLLGRSCKALTEPGPPWDGSRDLGVIAGDRSVGLGMLVARDLPRPHDGTVSLDETRLAGATDHITLPVTHISMLISPLVADQTAHFLRNGRFLRREEPEVKG